MLTSDFHLDRLGYLWVMVMVVVGGWGGGGGGGGGGCRSMHAGESQKFHVELVNLTKENENIHGQTDRHNIYLAHQRLLQ